MCVHFQEDHTALLPPVSHFAPLGQNPEINPDYTSVIHSIMFHKWSYQTTTVKGINFHGVQIFVDAVRHEKYQFYIDYLKMKP